MPMSKLLNDIWNILSFYINFSFSNGSIGVNTLYLATAPHIHDTQSPCMFSVVSDTILSFLSGEGLSSCIVHSSVCCNRSYTSLFLLVLASSFLLQPLQCFIIATAHTNIFSHFNAYRSASQLWFFATISRFFAEVYMLIYIYTVSQVFASELLHTEHNPSFSASESLRQW